MKGQKVYQKEDDLILIKFVTVVTSVSGFLTSRLTFQTTFTCPVKMDNVLLHFS